jgi:outer membrane protein assembly factor BamC
MTLGRSALAAALALALNGCGYIIGDDGVFRDRSEDYKKAPQTPPVSVPEGVESVEMRDLYVIPAVEDSYLSQGEFEVPRPAPLTAAAGEELVKIQKLGEDSWILIGVAPGQLWPQVRNFISATGMQVARADARAGIMESNWVSLEGERLPSRFRFRMEQGVQRGTSELHVLQMSQGVGSDEWPRKSASPALEGEMLQAVAQYLADSAESAPVSMIAEQGISAGGKIALREAPEGHSYLQLELPYDRAWASLARALEKSSFAITDRDRSSGIYYVRFRGDGSEEDEGWWASLWGEDEMPPSDRVYQVSMTSVSDEAVVIRIGPQDGVPLERGDEQEMLMQIKGNIN